MRVRLGPTGSPHDFTDTTEREQQELLLSIFHGLIPANQAVRVGTISRDLASKIGAHVNTVIVSPITIMKVKGKHAEILYSDLDLLQHGFNTARVRQDGPRHLIFLFRDPRKSTRTLKAVVKSTHRGSELILSSYFVCTGRRWNAAIKKGTHVRHAEK